MAITNARMQALLNNGLSPEAAEALLTEIDAAAVAPVTPAANVPVIAVPGTATAEDAANKVNAVINALVAADLMEAP